MEASVERRAALIKVQAREIARRDGEIVWRDAKIEKMSLTQMGISTWNPNTTSFLDYVISLRSILLHYNVSHSRAIHLLFSSLPSKYSYVRNAVRSHPDFVGNSTNYWDVKNIVIEMVVGGKDKIFSEYINVSNNVSNVRKFGSAALDMAYVACGRFDGYWQRELNYWDIAAGIIILKDSAP